MIPTPLLLFAVDADQTSHVNLAALTLPAAEKLHGRLVSVWLEVAKPVVTTDDRFLASRNSFDRPAARIQQVTVRRPRARTAPSSSAKRGADRESRAEARAGNQWHSRAAVWRSEERRVG